jgi:diguanylate cyclase (GGDEF)-like protein
MNSDSAILEMLSLIYEDLDIDTIEERFVNLVADRFPFDRVGLFFVKHKKGLLQGKLGRGFAEGSIRSMEVPIDEKYLLTRPLISGFPLWNVKSADDPFLQNMELRHFALIPVISRKRTPCWQITRCHSWTCPAYGNEWLRCWLLSDAKCKNGSELPPAEKIRFCETCPVFCNNDSSAIEGIMLVDGTEPISDETVTLLSIIGNAVGNAINNSKKYFHALREAIRDDLTGLYNRSYFYQRLIEEFERARNYGKGISVLFGDIDHLKRINDQYGHPVGDAVLKMVAGILQGKLLSDLVARYGGEEFAILLFGSSKEEAVVIAEHLRQAVASAILPVPDPVSVTICFGVATFGEDSNTLEGFLAKAQKALYRAKARGRNRVCTG